MIVRLKENIRLVWRLACLSLVACSLLLFLCGCDYARMKEDEALRTYETLMPPMPKASIPVNGGIHSLREADPSELHNPLAFNQQTVERGKLAYGYYCIQCHGEKVDGFATVGQSFAPLPTNLRSPGVQKQSDGDLFWKIRLGFRRHPPLAATVAAEDTWAIITYLRFLAGRSRVWQG